MANILDFLHGLLTTGSEQQQFERDPYDYLTTRGVTDLSGEDVVEGLRVLARTLPTGAGNNLSCYVDGNGDVPSPRPQGGETEVDAAVRQLQFAISLMPPAERPELEPSPKSEPGAADWPLEPYLVAESVREDEQEPVAAQTETELPMAAPPGAADPYAAFGDEVASIVRHAGEQMHTAVERAEEQAATILQQAARDANGIRDQANDEARTVYETAAREADALMQEARAAREEADARLQGALKAEREATETLADAEQESNTMLEEARARRESIREAERELRKRLEGVQDVFETLDHGTAETTEPGEG